MVFFDRVIKVAISNSVLMKVKGIAAGSSRLYRDHKLVKFQVSNGSKRCEFPAIK